MKRTLFLLLFCFCLTITVGKQVRALCAQFLAEKNLISKTLILDLNQSDAESEETDSEDSEESDGNDDHEITTPQILYAAELPSFRNRSASRHFKDHLKEIGTPPPRS